jgi:hypothetical protein
MTAATENELTKIGYRVRWFDAYHFLVDGRLDSWQSDRGRSHAGTTSSPGSMPRMGTSSSRRTGKMISVTGTWRVSLPWAAGPERLHFGLPMHQVRSIREVRFLRVSQSWLFIPIVTSL